LSLVLESKMVVRQDPRLCPKTTKNNETKTVKMSLDDYSLESYIIVMRKMNQF